MSPQLVHRPSRAVPPGVKGWLSTCSQARAAQSKALPFRMLISTSSLEVAKDRDEQLPRESSTSPDEKGL